MVNDVCDGKLPEICEIITKSEVCEGEDGEVTAWGECSLIQCLGVFVPFVTDITVGLTGLTQAVSPGNQGKMSPEIFS